MELDPRTIKKQFQKSLPKYGDHAIVQKIVAERMTDYIKGLEFSTIYEIGAGAGILTEQIVKKCKFHKYYANDLVEKSEMYIRKYIKDVTFLAGDFRKINTNKKFNLIASNAVFQWFNNLDVVLSKCANLLEPEGYLLFSSFSDENYKEFKAVCGLSLEYKTNEEIEATLKNKYEILRIENFKEVLQFDNPLKILAHMKNTGVNSLSREKWGIKEVKAFCERYSAIYPDLVLTYSPIIVLAKIK